MPHPQRRGAPVLFLDIDGVLNVAVATATAADGAFSPLHASLLDRLARVVRRSRARIVLSSSWRHDRQRLALLERAWRIAQLPPLEGVTPTLATAAGLQPSTALADHTADVHSRQRVLEIQQWLRDDAARRHPDADSSIHWAAVDDLDLAAAAGACDKPRFVRTDARRGLAVDDVETLVHLLTGEEADGNGHDAAAELASPLLPLPLESQVLQLSVDFLVIQSDASSPTAVVVDCADFSVVARLDTTRQSLRTWLRNQEADFSLDRIASVHLTKPTHDDASMELHDDPAYSLSVRVPWADTSVEAYAAEFARDAAASRVVPRLLEAVQRRDFADGYDADAATRQLQSFGISADAATGLATDPQFVASLFDVLPILQPLSPSRTDLAVEICRLFPEPLARKSRRTLTEYVARQEITSRAALEAVQLMWTTQDGTSEDLDEMMTAL